jgi:hypothetical protein
MNNTKTRVVHTYIRAFNTHVRYVRTYRRERERARAREEGWEEGWEGGMEMPLLWYHEVHVIHHVVMQHVASPPAHAPPGCHCLQTLTPPPPPQFLAPHLPLSIPWPPSPFLVPENTVYASDFSSSSSFSSVSALFLAQIAVSRFAH